MCLCFVWISEQTAIISLYSINWLVFITKTECVYCAVRTQIIVLSNINASVQSVNWHCSPASGPLTERVCEIIVLYKELGDVIMR